MQAASEHTELRMRDATNILVDHFNLTEALNLLEELKPEKAYLTHISHLMGLEEALKKELPPNVSLAYDRLKLEF